MTVKLEQDLVPIDQGNSEEHVMSRSMNQYLARPVLSLLTRVKPRHCEWTPVSGHLRLLDSKR